MPEELRWIRSPKEPGRGDSKLGFVELRYVGDPPFSLWRDSPKWRGTYTAMRQVVVEGQVAAASSHRRADFGLALGDQPYPLDGLEAWAEEISSAEFETAWSLAMEPVREQWEELKRTLPIGSRVAGVTYQFYPQGVLVDLGGMFLGIMDHQPYDEEFGLDDPFLVSGVPVVCQVRGHVDLDQWIQLELLESGKSQL